MDKIPDDKLAVIGDTVKGMAEAIMGEEMAVILILVPMKPVGRLMQIMGSIENKDMVKVLEKTLKSVKNEGTKVTEHQIRGFTTH